MFATWKTVLHSRRGRRTVAAIFFVAAIYVFAPYLWSRFSAAPRQLLLFSHSADRGSIPDEVSRTQIKLATFNIAHGRGPEGSNWSQWGNDKPARIAEIAAAIRQWDADIVVLNEVDFDSSWSGRQNQAESIAREAGFPYRVEQTNFDLQLGSLRWRFGNAVISKLPIVDARLVALPEPSSIESLLAGSKQAAVVRLRVSETQEVQLLAVHLDPRNEDIRVQAVDRILALAAADDRALLIAAGDFNSTFTSLPGGQRGKHGVNAIEILHNSSLFHLRSPSSNVLPQPTFPADHPRLAIDWIAIPKAWTFQDYQVRRVRLSDHLPVTATLGWPEPSLQPAQGPK